MAATLLLDNSTVVPAAGAGSLMVTVAVEDAPPVTVAGEKTSVVGARTRTVRLDATLTPPALAVIVAVAGDVTAAVATLNVALVCPAGTNTVPGTVAAALLLVKATDNPPAGAGAPICTVP